MKCLASCDKKNGLHIRKSLNLKRRVILAINLVKSTKCQSYDVARFYVNQTAEVAINRDIMFVKNRKNSSCNL